MAARGRGGGGRGRGRASLSFNVEQLGLGPGEVLPGPVLQPPHLFPPLEFKPAPLIESSLYDSQLLLKKNFLEYFTKSSACIRIKSQQQDIDQFASASMSKVFEMPFSTDWSFIPCELKPTLNKKKRKCGTSGIRNDSKKIDYKRGMNLNSWLEELEKKETTEENQEKEIDEKEKKKDEDDQEGEQNDELEDDEIDEEMDDGTDYNQNYFDNGEGYLDDEDDNLDDGPIY